MCAKRVETIDTRILQKAREKDQVLFNCISSFVGWIPLFIGFISINMYANIRTLSERSWTPDNHRQGAGPLVPSPDLLISAHIGKGFHATATLHVCPTGIPYFQLGLQGSPPSPY